MTTEQIFRSGDASEESGARAGESRQIAPAEARTCAVCGRHSSTIIVHSPYGLRRECMVCVDLETEDRGGPLLIVATIAAVVVLALLATALLAGCAPPRPASTEPAPTWCEDCAVQIGRR